MFKELKVIKLLVIVGLLVALILSVNPKEIAGIYLYTGDASYFQEDEIQVHFSSGIDLEIESELVITSLSEDTILNEKISFSGQGIKNENFVEKGFESTHLSGIKLPEGTPSGIYFLNEEFPLIVKSKEPAQITVVYPFGNNSFYHKFRGKSGVTEPHNQVSLNRGIPVDDYTLGIKGFLLELEKHYKVKYISDLDVEEYSEIDNTELVIVYGKSAFWSPKMKGNILKYMEEGGNLFLMSSYFMDIVMWYDRESRLLMNSEMPGEQEGFIGWIRYNGELPSDVIGVGYTLGGVKNQTERGYQIYQKNHPVMEGINDSLLIIEADLYAGIPVKWEATPTPTGILEGYQKAEIIAGQRCTYKDKTENIGGIYELKQSDSSGTILSVGTQDWCLEKNFDSTLHTISMNAVAYLLNQ